MISYVRYCSWFLGEESTKCQKHYIISELLLLGLFYGDCILLRDIWYRVPYKKTIGHAKSGITSKAGKHYSPNPNLPLKPSWWVPQKSCSLNKTDKNESSRVFQSNPNRGMI